ncbi:GNAT family N-acetyltransferase [Pseudonocardia spirodelae]|uniref:GNAT family N-acetyltransferase n=1 Tax=Pseudonocardia spirodelae TaxID=3133431 RepID=A0ABU8T5Q5_9PSEU
MGIRRAVVGDAVAIAGVHVRSWQVGYRGRLPDAVLDSLAPDQRARRWRDTLRAADRPGLGTLVATGSDGHHVVGFAHLTPSRDADPDPSDVGEIASFYVDPQCWRLGVGRELVSANLVALTGAGCTTGTLRVLATNARAIGFHHATGWSPDGGTKPGTMAGAPVEEVRYTRPLHPADGSASP